MFLVMVDSHSKGLDVISVSNANSTNNIRGLRILFATHGIPISPFLTMTQLLQIQTFQSSWPRMELNT